MKKNSLVSISACVSSLCFTSCLCISTCLSLVYLGMPETVRNNPLLLLESVDFSDGFITVVNLDES